MVYIHKRLSVLYEPKLCCLKKMNRTRNHVKWNKTTPDRQTFPSIFCICGMGGHASKRGSIRDMKEGKTKGNWDYKNEHIYYMNE